MGKRTENKEKSIYIHFKYTSTIGIREDHIRRYTLGRKEEILKTEFGEVREKHSVGYEVSKIKAL